MSNKIIPKKQIIINDLKINYYESENLDKNNALVFLHGWGANALIFQKVFKNLDNYISIDLPGFGESEMPKQTWGVGDYAGFLNNFLKKLNIKKPILIGHSFGGSVIIKYLAQGNIAKKAFLVCSAGIRKKTLQKTVLKIIAKTAKLPFFLPGLRQIKEKARGKFYYALGFTDYIASGKMKETFKEVVSEDLSPLMKKIKTKTIIIWGKNDKATPLEDGQQMHKLIPNSELFIIKNAGHYVFLDQEEKFMNIFLKNL